MLTIAYLNNILLHAEFSAMDYTLNIVIKCRFFFIFKHSRAPKRSWKIFHGVLESPGKVLDFFVSKRVETLVIGGGRKGIWPKLLPCASKSPTSVGTSEV